MTRTCDLLVRSQTLYPTELRARIINNLARIHKKVNAWICKSRSTSFLGEERLSQDHSVLHLRRQFMGKAGELQLETLGC